MPHVSPGLLIVAITKPLQTPLDRPACINLSSRGRKPEEKELGMIRFRRRCLYTSMNLQWKFIRPTFLFVKSIPPRSFEWERGRLPNMSVWMRGYLDSTQNYLINFPLIIRWTLYNCLNHICPKHSHLWCEAKDITTISKNYSHIHCRGLSWAIFHFYLPIEEL